VTQQWLSGDSRPKIAIDNNIGEGTVTGIVNNFKISLDNPEFECVIELAVLSKKQGLTISNLASHFRLYNYFKESGATEEEVESFITNINSSNIPCCPRTSLFGGIINFIL
jgi:hypothetical protein